MANQLRHYQLLGEEEFVAVLDSCRRRFEVSLEKRKCEEVEEEVTVSEDSEAVFPHEDWVIFHDKRAPFDTSASKVPPLRYAYCRAKDCATNLFCVYPPSGVSYFC